MEEVTAAARFHFDNTSDTEKCRVEEIFGEGARCLCTVHISKEALISAFPGMSEPCVLKLRSRIGKRGCEGLNLDEFKIFYYVITYRPMCHECMETILGRYYCCVQCWRKKVGGNRDTHTNFTGWYTLCPGCFTQRKNFHHPHHEFLDNYSFLAKQQKNEIERIIRAGRLFYRSLSEEQKEAANKAFREADRDNKNSLSRDDMVRLLNTTDTFVIEKVRYLMRIMQRQNLGVEDAASLWYIFTTRPLCDNCYNFMDGCYYSCLECSENTCNEGEYLRTYDICQNCYEDEEFDHHHHHFLDNYAIRIKNLLVGISQGVGDSPTDDTHSYQQVSANHPIAVVNPPSIPDGHSWGGNGLLKVATSQGVANNPANNTIPDQQVSGDYPTQLDNPFSNRDALDNPFSNRDGSSRRGKVLIKASKFALKTGKAIQIINQKRKGGQTTGHIWPVEDAGKAVGSWDSNWDRN